MNIYTKNGDGGFSKNIKNVSYQKDYVLFELIGTVDELSAALGLAKLTAAGAARNAAEALRLEFTALNSSIAGGEKFDGVSAAGRLEKLIDAFSQKIKLSGELTAVGKSEAGARFDFARTVARRAERVAVRANKFFLTDKNILAYFNRISDLLYILARYSDETGENAALPPYSGTGKLDLAEAGKLNSAVIEKARSVGASVVCAVCDSGGNLISLSRDDGAFTASINVAQNKAYTSVSLKMKTETLAELASPGGQLYGIQHQDSRIVIFGGGVPLFKNGEIVGGFGVSGGTAEQDGELAEYAAGRFNKTV
jgi:ATP:cob(I)alamin adenosyltransferase